MSLVPRRLRSLWRGGDQAASDADQTLSESDQTNSDSDQSLSERDQAAALADQEVSDREQALADRQLAAVEPAERTGRLPEYERAHTKRDEGTMSRVATGVARTLISTQRDEQAARRDEIARNRDRIAAERDTAADLADREAETLARDAGDLSAAAAAALDAAARGRALAAVARERAAADRERAAQDREAAAQDRAYLHSEMERSQLDEVTGGYRRGMGEILLRHELVRATRTNGKLALAFIDVDGLKEVNTRAGHAAGDALLRSVFETVKGRLRPYDPIVRWGGDEFVCAVAGASLDEARKRMEQVQADLAQLDPAVAVSFGLAVMEAGDTLEEMTERADAAQRRAKRSRDT